MLRVARSLVLVAGLLVVLALPARAADLENTLYLDVPTGRVVIALRPDLAPKTVAHIKALTRRLFLAAALLAGAAMPAFAQDAGNTLYLDFKDGRVTIALDPVHAPKPVAHLKELVRKGVYTTTPIHRVIPGFMAQMGDPTGTGRGGSGQKLPAEFSSEHHLRGTVSMARAQDPNSADSQFFICFAPAEYLDGQYTIWGHVIEGMQFVDMIKKGSGQNGEVTNPDKIIRMQVAADVKE
jgi:peptidylprolyl isomerase